MNEKEMSIPLVLFTASNIHREIHGNSRAALHVHGANFRRQPAHGLQRGVVITDLHTAAHEVLLLEDDHAAALVGLDGRKRHF